jgi:hypothetical protein
VELGGVEKTGGCDRDIKMVDMKTKKQAKASATKRGRSFSSVVGGETYAAWVRMLRELVPDGRTHRLSVVIAGMLHYAAIVAADQDYEDEEQSLAASLVEATEASDPSEVEDLIHDAVAQLFEDAKVRLERTSARGDRYSIAENAYDEFIHWFDMPWE